MKAISIKLSTVLTVVTLMGAFIAGGIAFGELRGGLIEHDKRIRLTEERMATIYEQITRTNEKITEVAVDLKWIRVLMEGYVSKEYSSHKEPGG